MTHMKWILGIALVLAGGVVIFWTRAEVGKRPTLGPERNSHHESSTPKTEPSSPHAVREPSPSASDGESEDGTGAKLPPERYRIRELAYGEKMSDYLAEYWGNDWEWARKILEDHGSAEFLDKVNQRQIDRPIGTIDDFMVGLEERTLATFERFHGDAMFLVPGLWSGDLRKGTNVTPAILKSSLFNPLSKELNEGQVLALASLVDDLGMLCVLSATGLHDRWVEVIKDCVRSVVGYEPSPFGNYVLAPLIMNDALVSLQVPAGSPYPVRSFVMPTLDWQFNTTEGGFFGGILKVWIGEDSQLRYHHDGLEKARKDFTAQVGAFVAELP